MEYALVILTIIAIIQTFRLSYWKENADIYIHKADKYREEADELTGRLKESNDLELATTEQIVKELSNRPNVSYVVLQPLDDGTKDFVVQTYLCNVSVETTLMSLRAAYDGISEQFGSELDEGELDEDI